MKTIKKILSNVRESAVAILSHVYNAVSNRMNLLPLFVIGLSVYLLSQFGDGLSSRVSQMGIMVIRLVVAGYVGYWISKLVLMDFRPDNIKNDGDSYMFFRSIIIGCSLIAAGMAI